jgi:undecaprenyl-phosphate 4-deoxy-4-formamido-L-arabinose transferase
LRALQLSVVIPVYNEEAGLQALFERLYPALDGLGIPYEVIFVDDGSRDRSAAQLRAQFEKRPEATRVIVLNGNYGQHLAIMAGFERCRGDVIVTLDADLQNPPEEIGNLLAKFEEGHDYVGSIRKVRRDNVFRRVASRLLNALRERTTKIKMTDQGCMLRAYSRQIIEAINNCREINIYIPALAYTFARHPAEIEVRHEERQAGKSKYSLYKLVRLNFDLMTGFSVVPLQMFSVLGIVVSLASMLTYVVVMISRWLSSGSLWEGLRVIFDRDILAFFLIGIVLFGLGLLGEYVGRVYEQVRGRPRYLIAAVLERTTTEFEPHSKITTQDTPEAARRSSGLP